MAIDSKHFRPNMRSETKSLINDKKVIDFQFAGGDEVGPSELTAGNYANDMAVNLRNEDGYFYFVSGHSRYGGKDRVGP